MSIFGNPTGYNISGEISILEAKSAFTHPEDAIKAGLPMLLKTEKATV